MTDKILITVDYLRKRLRYDQNTGQVFWLDFDGMSDGWRSRWAEKEAFTTLCQKGYKHGMICGRPLKAHRVIWALHYGEWPENQIDHINGVRSDNRICNLRSVTNNENCRNMAMSSANKSGVTGVHWNKKAKKWRAAIMVSGKEHHLGFFDSLEEAAEVRHAAQKHYNFSDRHGLPHDPSSALAKPAQGRRTRRTG